MLGGKIMMKKIFIILGGLIGLFILFAVGYFIGNRMGTTYGAQQYTWKMWRNNDMQISANKILDKINELRAQNNLKPYVIFDSLCKVANIRAKDTYDKATGSWNQQKQEYDKSQQNAPESTDPTYQMISKTCPECDLKTYTDIKYIVLRPDTCWNFAGKKVCEGEENFGVVEKYPDRVVNSWNEEVSLKSVLSANVKSGCVGVYGGAVVLSVANLNK